MEFIILRSSILLIAKVLIPALFIDVPRLYIMFLSIIRNLSWNVSLYIKVKLLYSWLYLSMSKLLSLLLVLKTRITGMVLFHQNSWRWYLFARRVLGLSCWCIFVLGDWKRCIYALLQRRPWFWCWLLSQLLILRW